MKRPFLAMTFTMLTIAACGDGAARFSTAKYPPAPDRMARIDRGAAAAGCTKESVSTPGSSFFTCGKKSASVTGEDTEKELAIVCSGTESECSAMLEKFVAMGK